MTAHTAVPQPLKVVGRKVSVRVGAATPAHRRLPAFVVVGAQRAGTTSLYRALLSHPLVHSANHHKGVNYFDVNHHRGPAWYRGHFPTAATLRRRTPRDLAGHEPITFEASGYYLFHPCAPARMAHELPELKVVAMLRDPVERAFSAWKHERARGFETEEFERALDLEDERLAGQVERMLADPRHQSADHRHHAYVRRGQYAEQLDRFARHYPADRIHLVESEAFFERPEETYAALLDFLGLPRLLPGRFDRWNGRPSSPMAARTRDRLAEHFRVHDEALAERLGREPAWRS